MKVIVGSAKGRSVIFLLTLNPLGMAILTLALSAVSSGMRTTSHLRKPGTSPTSMTSMTLVYWRCYCILNAQSAKQ